MVIGKRYAARAVTRNTLKRIIREVFRTTRHLLSPADYIVRLYVPVPAMSLSVLKLAVRAELDSHFTRLAR
jgi:ribonuclease P protein component